MKKMIIASAFTMLCMATQAQTQKGNLMIGGTLGGINFSSTGSSNNFTVDVSPIAGKFIANNLAVGGSIDFIYDKTTHVNGKLDYGIAPFVRYYFKNDGKNGFFGQAKFGIGVHSFDDGIPSTDNSSTTLIYGAVVGYNRFFTENVALEMGLGYTGNNPTKSGVKSTNIFGLNIGLQIFLPTKKAKSLLRN